MLYGPIVAASPAYVAAVAVSLRSCADAPSIRLLKNVPATVEKSLPAILCFLVRKSGYGTCIAFPILEFKFCNGAVAYVGSNNPT